jgi:tripartite-type tricarboxylate transporter receptor subunit TctC
VSLAMRTKKMNKYNLLAKVISISLLTVTPLVTAYAQDKYPSKQVRVVVGFPAGSATDVATRILANQMSQDMGQPFVVENRPGASSDIAAKAVASSAADGYTLFVLTIANVINTSSGRTDFTDIEKSFAPVAMIGSVPIMLVANADQKINSVKDLVTAAKVNPKAISYASSGNGTAPHLSGELFAKIAGVDILHVPYKGSSQAVTDLLAGRVNIMFAPASTVLPHTKSGRLVGLGVASSTRIPSAPDLPTLAESGLKEFESSVWFGLVAPVGTPASVVSALSSGASRALASPQVQDLFAKQGVVPIEGNPNVFGSFIQAETKKWTSVIKDANVKL